MNNQQWRRRVSDQQVYERAERPLGCSVWLGYWASQLIRRLLRLERDDLQ